MTINSLYKQKSSELVNNKIANRWHKIMRIKKGLAKNITKNLGLILSWTENLTIWSVHLSVSPARPEYLLFGRRLVFDRHTVKIPKDNSLGILIYFSKVLVLAVSIPRSSAESRQHEIHRVFRKKFDTKITHWVLLVSFRKSLKSVKISL